ncbi:unnamed protein product, partial [Thlaspi arvense]
MTTSLQDSSPSLTQNSQEIMSPNSTNRDFNQCNGVEQFLPTNVQSFKSPLNTLLQKMRLSINNNTGEKIVLKSWRSLSDPSVGIFFVGIDPLTVVQLAGWNGNSLYWLNGLWDGRIFIGLETMNHSYLNRVTFEYDEGSASIWKNSEDGVEHGEARLGGHLVNRNSIKSLVCSCSPGFKPAYKEEWEHRNFNGGCCEKNGTGKKEGFQKLTRMKLPDSQDTLFIPETYTYYLGIDCMLWSECLVELQEVSKHGADLYIHLTSSELGDSFCFNRSFCYM